MFYCNAEKCIKNSVKCPLSSECSSWYISILAPLISPNNECDLVISRFVCPPRPAAPLQSPTPPHPHTQVYWLNVMRSLQASSVNVFIWQTEPPATSLDLHPKRHLTKINSMAQSGKEKSIQIITGPVGKHVELPQLSFPEKKRKHTHTQQSSHRSSGQMMPSHPSKYVLFTSLRKYLLYWPSDIPTKKQKKVHFEAWKGKSFQVVKKRRNCKNCLLNLSKILIRWAATLRIFQAWRSALCL